MFKRIQKRTMLLVTVVIAGLLAPLVFDFGTTWIAADRLHGIDDVPERKVALVLGTSATLRDGRANLYFQYRMETAAALWHAGKVRVLLVSGDNGTDGYDETSAMKQDLVSRGVPIENIFCDYAGFRTLDSVVRAREIFGQERALVVSQKWHNERAIVLGGAFGVDLDGVNAEDVAGRAGLLSRLREVLARSKMILDIVVGTSPRFLGEKIEIPDG